MRCAKLVIGLLLATGWAQAGMPFPARLPPADTPDETLSYDRGPSAAYAVSGATEYFAAVRFTPEATCTLKAVLFYKCDPAENGAVYVYGPNSRTRPGDRLATVSYSGSGSNQWRRVDLSEPVVCPESVDFWTAVKTIYYYPDHPLGVDVGPMVRYRGGYIKVPYLGEQWYQLYQSPFFADRNWNQRAIVSFEAGVEETIRPALPRPVLSAAPNPFRCRTMIRYATADRLVVYDAAGRAVRQLPMRVAVGGERTAVWDGTDDAGRPLPGGVYFCRSGPAGGSESLELVLLR